MYLIQLRENDPSHTDWKGMGQRSTLLLDRCFEIVDASLNSWKEAHDAFNNRVKNVHDPKMIATGVHSAFTRLIVKALKECEDYQLIDYGTNVYPRELLAYALLKVWIEREIAEDACKKAS